MSQPPCPSLRHRRNLVGATGVCKKMALEIPSFEGNRSYAPFEKGSMTAFLGLLFVSSCFERFFEVDVFVRLFDNCLELFKIAR